MVHWHLIHDLMYITFDIIHRCIDLTNGDNFGLLPPIEALHSIVDKFTHFGMTRADIWVLAALEGARGAQVNDGDARPFEMT